MKRLALMIAALGLFLFAQAAQADWTPAKRLTWNSGMSTWPALAVDSSGAFHLVWNDDTPGNTEIYYKKSTDGGATWSAGKRLTVTAGFSYHPRIGVDPLGNLHVVWDDGGTTGYGEIYYTKSTDGGSTWSAAKRLTWNSGSSERPVIGIDSLGNLHVAWEDDTPGYPNYDIYYKKSTDYGVTWSAAKRLTWTSEGSIDSALTIDSSDRLHLFWSEGPGSGGEIYYAKSTNAGATWSASRRLTWTSGGSAFPAIAMDSSGRFQLVWQEDLTTSYEIYYKKSSDGGANWTTGKKITTTSGSSFKPAVAADLLGALHVVWSDDTPGHPDIYYRMSADGGTTWATTRRLSWTAGNSFRPAIAADSSGNLVVAWDDFTPGNLEIYYVRYTK
jgi:BNR repeat-like domain